MEGKELFYINGYGIPIKKCCASCRHMQPNGRTRICDCGEGIVSPSSHCMNWDLRKGLDNAGKGGGTVKKGHYLHYFIETASTVRVPSCPDKILFRKKLMDEIREKYEKKFGSIYLMKK